MKCITFIVLLAFIIYTPKYIFFIIFLVSLCCNIMHVLCTVDHLTSHYLFFRVV